MSRLSPAILVLAALTAGCALPDGPATYVGSAEGSDVKVGAVAAGGKVTFYACGGAETIATDTRWFKGDAPDPRRFSLEKDGWKLAGDLEAGRGTLTDPEGRALRWSLSPAAGDDEGLYSAPDGGGCRTGAIVGTGDDGERWVQGAWCEHESDGSSIFAQVTPILPYTRTARGLRVNVRLPDQARELVVERVMAP